MKVIVISHRHGMLPFAWRLRKEGADVTVIVAKDRYEKAWEGLLDKDMRGKGKSQTAWEQLLKVAIDEQIPILTDSPKIDEMLRVYREEDKIKNLREIYYGSYQTRGSAPLEITPLVLGFWFTPERGAEGLHYIFPDYGLWPGGLGPSNIAGGSLYAPTVGLNSWTGVLPLDELEEASHRGLVNIHLKFNRVTSEFESTGFTAGWFPVFSHLFLSELNLLPLLEGKEPVFPVSYVVNTVVSTPPYPYECNLNSTKHELKIPNEDLKDMFLHDVVVKDQRIQIAGTDGLLAIVRGSSNIFDRARQLSVGRAARIEVPQLQLRPDIGSRVSQSLAALDELGLL